MGDAILIGGDFGTGGAKVCFMESSGRVLHEGYEEYPLYNERPGFSEHDAERYWEAFARLVRQGVTVLGARAADVCAIALSSALPSLVLIDARGEPVARAVNLMDRRALAQVDRILALLGQERICALTGNRIEDHPALVNVLWFKDHRPEIYARARWALTADGFVAHRLTGRATLNRSCATFFGVAYDIHRLCFEEDVLELVGLRSDLLPELVECSEQIGRLTPGAAAALGLDEQVVVVGGQVDCNAAWLAGGAVAPGAFQINLGTCGVIGVVHDQPQFLHTDAGRLVVNIPYTTDVRRHYSAVAVTMTGGQVLRYLRDEIGALERLTAHTLACSPYDLLTLQAQRVPAGSDGLIALPYFMGERTPLWDSSARAAYVGLSLHHGRGHLIRAMLEGVAYALRWSLETLRSGGIPIKEPLVFNEGGARSSLWRRIVTDVLEVRTALLTRGGGAALGDAILAGVGAGVLPGLDVAARLCELGEPLEPDPAVAGVYRRGFEAFRETYAALSGPLRAAGHSAQAAASAPGAGLLPSGTVACLPAGAPAADLSPGAPDADPRSGAPAADRSGAPAADRSGAPAAVRVSPA